MIARFSFVLGVYFLVTPWPIWASSIGSRSAACKLDSSLALRAEARQILSEFSSIESDEFDIYYHFSNEWRLAVPSIWESVKTKSHQERQYSLQQSSRSPAEQLVKNILNKYKSQPLLGLLNKPDLLNPIFLDYDHSAFSTYSGWLTVNVSRVHLKRASNILSSGDFETFLAGVLAHEIAHYIFDINFHYNRIGDSHNPKHNNQSSIEYTNYHTLIDAIAVELSGLSMEKYVELVLGLLPGIIDVAPRFVNEFRAAHKHRIKCLSH